ncbi:MAG: O-antigen ligase family protein, partial [Nitrospinota bacterium]
HFAGYVGLALGLALGYLMTLERRPIGRGLFGQVGDKTPPSAEEIGPKRVLLGFVITIMTAALFLSLSRGGVISVMLALAFFTFLLGMRRTQRRKRRAVPVILSLVLVFLVWTGIDPVLHRLSTLLEPSAVEDARPVLWQDTLGLIGHFPLVGTGLGTFRHVYPRYKTVPSQRLYTHAHNDYVELASEAGLAGFFLVVGALGFGLAWSTRRWFQRRDPYAVGLALGGLTAVAAFLIHDAVDFNFHIPANALTVSAVVGLLVSAVHLKSRGGSGESPPVSPASALGRLCCTGVLVVSVLAAAAVTATWAADGYLRRGVKTRSLEDMRRAAALEPWSAEPRYWTGKLWEQRGLETTSYQEQAEAFGRVRRAYEEALTLAPTEAKYHLSLAWSLHRLASLNDQKRRISPSRALMERAYHHYRLARELDPSNRFIGDYVSRSAPATLR